MNSTVKTLGTFYTDLWNKMKADQIPSDSKCFWLRCTRKGTGLRPDEVWFCAAGYTREMANRCRDDAAKMWPEIIYEVADHVPQQV